MEKGEFELNLQLHGGLKKETKKLVRGVSKPFEKVVKAVVKPVAKVVGAVAGLGGEQTTYDTSQSVPEVQEVRVDPAVTNLGSEDLSSDSLATKKRRKRGFASTMSSLLQSGTLAGGENSKTTLG